MRIEDSIGPRFVDANRAIALDRDGNAVLLKRSSLYSFAVNGTTSSEKRGEKHEEREGGREAD